MELGESDALGVLLDNGVGDTEVLGVLLLVKIWLRWKKSILSRHPEVAI